MQLQRIQRWQSLVIVGLTIIAMAAKSSYAADEPAASGKNRPRANRLRKETSPYLLLHANNPVDWYPWGPEAFEKAKNEGKLIFLSIGYSSCYWCHVMERKVFTNEAIAKTLNQDFVCIKVDREERPDVDEIYMTALQVYYQAIGAPSNGGWPLSIFLTPDGKPVAGGTYFPPEDTDGAQGFPTVLARLSDLWKNKHDDMIANSEILTKETKRVMKPTVSQEAVEVDDALVGFIFDSVAASFDPEFGGIDFHPDHPNGPKFPTPVKLAFLQQQLQRTPIEEVAALLDLTLMQMACGGIRDHLGGGFHRYSVDRTWDVPHFEKMLYDQAQMADLFTTAYRVSQQPLYKQVAEELLDFVERELTSPEGGFYSALDAETNGVEGDYYVWDASEIDRILGADATKFKDAYRVKDLSDFEQGNVLRLNPKRLPKAASKETLAANKGLPGSERDEFSIAKQKLLEVRNLRKRPLRDDKILTGWNGLMIGAFARASTALNHPEYARTAERAATFMLTKLRDPQGRLLHCSTKGQARLNAYLDDYAYLISGLLALSEATEDPKWMKSARELQDDQLRMFLDSENGGFYFTSHQHEALLTRTKNCYDGVQPAANSVSVRNLIKLGSRNDLDEARAIIELFAPQVEQTPRGFASFALATAELLETEAQQKGDKNDQTKDKGNPAEIVQASKVDEKAADKEPLILLADQKEERPKKDDKVIGRAYLSTDKLPAGGTCKIIVLLDVKEGWHIQANPPDPDYLKATKVSFKSNLGVELTDAEYPKGKKENLNGVAAMIYDGEVAIRGTLKVPEKAGGQMDSMEISIVYQACNDAACEPPKTIKLTGKLGVAKKGEAVKAINSRLFPPPDAPKK